MARADYQDPQQRRRSPTRAARVGTGTEERAGTGRSSIHTLWRDRAVNPAQRGLSLWLTSSVSGVSYHSSMATYSAHDVASEIRKRLPGVPVKKLHKLLYYCQAHHVATFNRPMFTET